MPSHQASPRVTHSGTSLDYSSHHLTQVTQAQSHPEHLGPHQLSSRGLTEHSRTPQACTHFSFSSLARIVPGSPPHTYLSYIALPGHPLYTARHDTPACTRIKSSPPPQGCLLHRVPQLPRASSAQRVPGPPWPAPASASCILRGCLWEIVLGLPRLHLLRLQISFQDTLHTESWDGPKHAPTGFHCPTWISLWGEPRDHPSSLPGHLRPSHHADPSTECPRTPI